MQAANANHAPINPSDSDTDDYSDGTQASGRRSRGLRGGRRVRRYRFTCNMVSIPHYFSEDIVDEPYEEGPVDGDYLELIYQSGSDETRTTVHADLYAFAAKTQFGAKRTMLQARSLMHKCMNYCTENKLGGEFKAYQLTRPVVKAVMALTPAEKDLTAFFGSAATQEHLDRADEVAEGKHQLQLTWKGWLTRIFFLLLNITIIMSTHLFIYYLINMLAARTSCAAIDVVGGFITALVGLYGIYDVWCRYKTKFYRIIPVK